MKLKLDENLGPWAAAVLRDAGFETATVSDQRLEGVPDRTLIDRCRDEARCLVTMDVEFGNPLLFPPREFRGIVLIRVHGPAGKSVILEAMKTLRDALMASGSPADASIPLAGPDRRLWVVEPGRVRLYQPLEGDPD